MICPGSIESPFHIGIATPWIDESMAHLADLLGLRFVALPRPPGHHDTPTGPTKPAPRVVYSAAGPLHLELLESAQDTVYAPELGVHLHHVGYWVDDLSGAIADAEQSGWHWEVTMMDDDGRPSTFAYLTRPGQTRIELVDRANRDALMEILKGSEEHTLWSRTTEPNKPPR